MHMVVYIYVKIGTERSSVDKKNVYFNCKNTCLQNCLVIEANKM